MSTAPEQKQPQTGQDRDTGAVDAVLGVLAVGAAASATAASVAALLVIPVSAVAEVFKIVGASTLAAFKQSASTGTDNPLKIAIRANLRFRAAYILTAARRIATAPDKKTAIAHERTYWTGHQRASARRLKMARRAAAAAKRYGPMLGWYAKMDNRTSAECRAADGRNFHALQPPVIGYPGAVHPHCRCVPGPPHPGSKLVNDSLTVRRSDAASGFHR